MQRNSLVSVEFQMMEAQLSSQWTELALPSRSKDEMFLLVFLIVFAASIALSVFQSVHLRSQTPFGTQEVYLSGTHISVKFLAERHVEKSEKERTLPEAPDSVDDSTRQKSVADVVASPQTLSSTVTAADKRLDLSSPPSSYTLDNECQGKFRCNGYGRNRNRSESTTRERFASLRETDTSERVTSNGRNQFGDTSVSVNDRCEIMVYGGTVASWSDKYQAQYLICKNRSSKDLAGALIEHVRLRK